ncbi:uncharacterized protein LOC115232428 [Octopus sinensis]|uniref:Metalloendopeptidase n=1 Tax=Octopus sinensis TaxID=2607531 RepID=A0A6P7U9W9_9MOLL|nr:uncharacterized protein LOC115232428 [Octopus sinensis]
MKLQVCVVLLLCSFIRTEESGNYNFSSNSEVIQKKASFIFVDNKTEYRWEPNDLDKPSVEEYISNVTKVLEGDIFVEENPSPFSKRKAVLKLKRWKNKTVPWKFNTDKRKFDFASSYSTVKKAISIVESNCCLRFPEWTTKRADELGPAYLDIGKGDGCGSYVGYSKGRHHMLLLRETFCMKIGIVVHELCHALGFYHEHARRDRDKYITVHFENVDNSKKENFNIHFPTYNYVEYDYESLMQYGPLAYSKNMKTTIDPKDEHLQFLLGQRSKLSFYDRKTINLFYECNDLCIRPLKSCKYDGYIDYNCTCYCPSGLEGDDCSRVENQNECGGILSLDFRHLYTQIYFNSNLNKTGKANKCVWLIESPALTRMEIAIDNLRIKKEKYNCLQWLEMRYNLIGQHGPRFCGVSAKLNHSFNTTTNIAMLILESSNNLDNISFEVNVSISTDYNADINCTFELGNDFCVFKQTGGSDKWLISSNAERVKGVRGHHNSEKYIYLRPTTRPGNINGVLESRLITGGRKCIGIYYIINVEPSAFYRLNLYISSPTENKQPIVLRKSRYRNWQKYEFSVVSAYEFKLTIRGIIRNGRDGYIALDDISLMNGMCPGETEVITISEGSQIKCNFETDVCNYEWNPTKETRFLTKSSTKQCPDGCLIISASNSIKSEVRSPVQSYKGPSCLAIKYRIGRPGKLDMNLYVTDPSENKKFNVWHFYGPKENLNFDWFIKDIDVNFSLIQLLLTVKSQRDSVPLYLSEVWFDSVPCQESLRKCNHSNLPCMFRPNENSNWKDARRGVTFGNEKISISEKNHFANHGWLRSPSNTNTVRSSLMYLNGIGCLIFNFYAHGFLPHGIMLTKFNAYYANKDIIWKSDYRKQLRNPLVQIEIESKGYFTLEFSILKEDLFVSYEIEDFEMHSGHCTRSSRTIIRTLHQH